MAEQQSADETFSQLLRQLDDDRQSGMVSYVDSTLNRIADHVRQHPEVLGRKAAVDAYLSELSQQVVSLWEHASAHPCGRSIGVLQ